MAETVVQAGFAEAAERVLKAFPVGPAELTFVHISENITFRATEADTGRRFVLRLHRPTYHTLEALKSERIWTRALSAAGVGVPEPVRALSGDDYVAAEANGETRWAGLARWVDGDLLSQVLETETDPARQAGHFSRLGGMLAVAHNQASGWRPPPGFTRHSLDADGLMGERPFWGPFWDHRILSPAERALLIATRDRIHAALTRYGKPERTYSMIHADLHPLNVLVSDAGLAMIDFDDSAFGWHQYDLAVALLPYDTHPHFPSFRDALIEGYRAGRDISDEDLSLLPMLMLTRRMAQLGWLHERPELGESPRVQSMKDLACEAAARFTPPC